MDLTYPRRGRGVPRARSARGSRRTSPRAGSSAGFPMTAEERRAVQHGVARDALQGRVDLRELAGRVRRQGAHARSSRSCSTRSSPRPARRCAPTSSATPSSARRSCSGAPRSRSASSSRGSCTARPRGARGSASPTPGRTSRRLSTSAVLDGDEWVINGQKVWTTQAQHADYIFLLARTDPDAPKHAGISYLLVPMRQPGVEVRPITQVDGTAEFNEVFFTDARCPADNVVGGVNNGWKVAMTTLGFERGSVGHHELPPLPEGVGAARRRGAPARHGRRRQLVRDGLVRSWTDVQDHAGQRLPHADRRAQRHARGREARRVQQDVLVRGAPSRRWSSALDVMGMRGPDPRPGTGQRRGAPARAPRAAAPTTRCPTCRRASSSAAPRRSGAAPPRSSATSSASAHSGCPKEPSPQPA